MSVPYQNIVIINRQKPKANFLQIKNENWQNMLLKTKDPYALELYIYLASNADGYRLELSPQAIYNAIGMSRSTYYKKLELLKKNGYIIEKQGNILEFYEVPQEKKNAEINLPAEQENPSQEQEKLPQAQESLSQKQGNLSEGQTNLPQKQNCSQQNREIDKKIGSIHNKDNLHDEDKIHIGDNYKRMEAEGFVF